MEFASIWSKSCCMVASSTKSCVMTPSVGEVSCSSVPPSMTGASGLMLPSGSCVRVKWSYAMQLPPLSHVICDERVTGVSFSRINRMLFSVQGELPMMPLLPGWQVTVTLSSVCWSASRTVTNAWVAALLVAKALVRNLSSYSPAGKAEVCVISEVALPHPYRW